MAARLFSLVCALFIIGTLPAAAPPALQAERDLAAEDVEITQAQDVYGQTIQVARGLLVNHGDDAYTNINLTGAVYDEDDAQVGDAFGVLVNACGAGLLFDFALQPDAAHAFVLTLELSDPDATPARVEVIASGDPVAPTPPDSDTLPQGIVQISDQEVVAVEWEDADTFRYATGCEHDLFTEWDWRRYDVPSERDRQIEHPNAEAVTDELRELLRLQDPLIFANSRLRFAPVGGERLVYQDEVNAVWTAAADGRFQRMLFTGLNSYSLQGYTWLPDNRFLAYYYGAYGDPVIYYTADVEGRFISRPPLRSKPSQIIPGATADGLRAIIAGTFDDVTGYFIDLLAQNFFELLFEADVPGNNYPPPVPLLNEDGSRVTQIYIIRPVDEQPRLQCFYRPAEGDNELVDLAPMPFNLAIDERAWTFLSPDEHTIALSANGVHGGLWLIDLQALPACGEAN